jgi:hypothetical protein
MKLLTAISALCGSEKVARSAELARLMVEQSRDDILNEFDWTPSVSLEDAGLEESQQCPVFGNTDVPMDGKLHHEGSVIQYLEWFSDGDTLADDLH